MRPQPSARTDSFLVFVFVRPSSGVSRSDTVPNKTVTILAISRIPDTTCDVILSYPNLCHILTCDIILSYPNLWCNRVLSTVVITKPCNVLQAIPGLSCRHGSRSLNLFLARRTESLRVVYSPRDVSSPVLGISHYGHKSVV